METTLAMYWTLAMTNVSDVEACGFSLVIFWLPVNARPCLQPIIRPSRYCGAGRSRLNQCDFLSQAVLFIPLLPSNKDFAQLKRRTSLRRAFHYLYKSWGGSCDAGGLSSTADSTPHQTQFSTVPWHTPPCHGHRGVPDRL